MNFTLTAGSIPYKIKAMKITALCLCFIILFASASFALNVNDSAPLFSLRDSSSKIFYLSDYTGVKGRNTKGLIINFFASHCEPCKHELPVLNSLVDEFKSKGIKVVIIGYREDFDKIFEMLNEIKVDKPIILSDVYGKVGEKYGVKGLPMTIFIGANGKVKDIIRGELPNIEKVLREKAGRLLR
ncbi:MAG: hypothetical protein C0415_00035 [Thermodesulfovibrio sp.]|nr:hypothetical protein [Thermodesulfovibrio sp.]